MGLFGQRKSRRRVVAIASDWHSGHRLALCNPEVAVYQLDEVGDVYEAPPELTSVQEDLWRIYQSHTEQALAFADGDPLILVVPGDVTQGNKYGGGLMPLATVDDQVTIAEANCAPWLAYDGLQAIRFFSGTSAHVKLNQDQVTSEAKLAARLRAKRPGLDVQARHHGRLAIDGMVLDCAHHGPGPGIREWTSGNVARLYLRSRMLTDRKVGMAPAYAYVRGHVHVMLHAAYDEVWCGQREESHICIAPSYQRINDFAQKVTQSIPICWHGMWLLEVIDGKPGRIEQVFDVIDVRVEESV